MTVKNRLKVTAVAVLIIFAVICLNAMQVNAKDSNSVQKAKRTVMLYLCGSNLETDAAMATYNIKQILNSEFSSDEDVRFIIMTGGTKNWNTDPDWLVFSEGVNVPDDAVMDKDEYGNPEQAEKDSQISNVYNQIWEAKGKDAQKNAGKMVLLDGDGITGEQGEAVKSEDEFMSAPKTLKTFIDFCAENYPAEKYDLILWDHGGGQIGGFGYDEHDATEKMMSFSGITSALSESKVVDQEEGKPAGKFDFIDFDACLMSGIEFQLVLSDYTDYFIASPETEPGYGQYYTGWLNKAGSNPDIDTFKLGQQIVDDFKQFYEYDEGVGQEGTLTVTDTKKFKDSGIAGVLSDLNDVMKSEAACKLFYDEFRSFDGTIRYGDDNFFDLGNLASLITMRYSEVSDEELAGDGDISDSNAYNEKNLTARISMILSDLNDEFEHKDMIYGIGTEGIVSRNQWKRNMDGSGELADLETSGVQIFFPSPEYLSDAVKYYDEMAKVLERMPDKEDGRYAFLDAYRKTMIDYALIGLTGRTVNDLINTEKKNKEEVDYAAVRNYWREGKDAKEDLEYTQWESAAEPLLERREGGEQGSLEWLDSLVKQQADEALSLDNVSSKEVKSKDGTGYKVHISDVKNRCIKGIKRSVTAEIPVLEDYMKENLDEEGRKALESSAAISLGSVDAEQDYLSEIGIDSSESDVIRWMNKKESSWDIGPVEEKWYAIKDAEDKLHTAAILKEDEKSYTVMGLNMKDGEDGDQDAQPVKLVFSKDDGALSEIIFLMNGSSPRPVKVKELTEQVKIVPVIYVNYYELRDFFLPISNSPVSITKDNADKIKMIYTDVSDIKDIKDTDGDRKVLHSTFIATDIYNDQIDISDKVNSTTEKLVKIELARVRTGIYNDGVPVVPEVVYNGKTLEEGKDKDYTWEKYVSVNDETTHELKDRGEYLICLEGHGKFTGSALKEFRIVMAEDAAEAGVYAAQDEVDAATRAVEEAKTSGDKDALNNAYERLVTAQNALAEAQMEYSRTKDAMAKEKQEELEEQISMLKDQVEELAADLDEAMVIDISNYTVIMEPSIEFNGNGNEIEVSVPGIDPADYIVNYYDNWDVGTATLKIIPKSRKYKGTIIRKYKITPRKIAPDVTITPSSYIYDGKTKTPAVIVDDEMSEYKEGRDYNVVYPPGRKNAGKYNIRVDMTGNYTGSVTRSFTISRAGNTLKTEGKKVSVKYKKLKKKAQKIKCAKAITVVNAKGSLTYKLVSSKKFSSVKKKSSKKKKVKAGFMISSKTGKITVKKGLKKGTYELKVKVRAAGNNNFKASAWQTVMVKVSII